MSSTAHVRLLNDADLPAAFELSWSAGWNQTADDWQLLLQAAPAGCFGLECDGRLAATATLVCYGTRLAWIGMVLTHAEYRRRGFARALMLRTLELAASRGVATVKLDATDQGRPLYEALGFRAEQPIERWARESLPPVASMPQPDVSMDSAADASPLPHTFDSDPQIFGADRSDLLRTLSQRGNLRVHPSGYLLDRPGTCAHYLGPCVANSTETAAGMIAKALRETRSQRYFWDLLPENREAVETAQRFGFAPLRHLTRMVLGEELRPPGESSVYAIAGFEWG